MADSADFYSSEIWGDRFTDFCVHTADYWEVGSKKSSDSKKIRQWDHGISQLKFSYSQSISKPLSWIVRDGYSSHMLDTYIHVHHIHTNTYINAKPDLDQILYLDQKNHS